MTEYKPHEPEIPPQAKDYKPDFNREPPQLIRKTKMEIKSFSRKKATRKILWRFWLARPEWAAPKRFGFEYCGAQLGGVLYAGLVLFGWTLIYSSDW